MAGTGSGTGGRRASGPRDPPNHLAQGVVLGRRQPLLADWGIVVVAGDVGLVALASGVGPRGEAEVRPAVNDVEVEGLPGPQQERHLLRQVVERGARPFLAPVREPARVGLGREDGDARRHGAGQRPVLLVGAGVQADGRTLDVARLEHVGRGAVGREERDVDPVPHPHLLQTPDVGPVVAVAAVLVLDLQHQDRAAACDEQRPHHLRQLRDVPLGRVHVARVEAADPDVWVLKQVGRDASEVPLRADVRPGPQQHPHALFLRDADEAGDVVAGGGEVERARRRLVEVPEDVGGDRVAAHRLRHPDAVAPVLRRDARRVHLAGNDLEGLPVEQEVFAAHRERVPRALPGRRPRERRQDRQQRDATRPESRPHSRLLPARRRVSPGRCPGRSCA